MLCHIWIVVVCRYVGKVAVFQPCYLYLHRSTSFLLRCPINVHRDVDQQSWSCGESHGRNRWTCSDMWAQAHVSPEIWPRHQAPAFEEVVGVDPGNIYYLINRGFRRILLLQLRPNPHVGHHLSKRSILVVDKSTSMIWEKHTKQWQKIVHHIPRRASESGFFLLRV